MLRIKSWLFYLLHFDSDFETSVLTFIHRYGYFITGTSSYGDDRQSNYDGSGKSRRSPFDKFRQMEQNEDTSKSNSSQR